MSRRTARRQRFYSDLRREPCYLGGGEFDHDWRYVSDWYGDPDVINGTADCSRYECRICGAEDYLSDPPGDDFEDWL